MVAQPQPSPRSVPPSVYPSPIPSRVQSCAAKLTLADIVFCVVLRAYCCGAEPARSRYKTGVLKCRKEGEVTLFQFATRYRMSGPAPGRNSAYDEGYSRRVSLFLFLFIFASAFFPFSSRARCTQLALRDTEHVGHNHINPIHPSLLSVGEDFIPFPFLGGSTPLDTYTVHVLPLHFSSFPFKLRVGRIIHKLALLHFSLLWLLHFLLHCIRPCC